MGPMAVLAEGLFASRMDDVPTRWPERHLGWDLCEEIS